MQAASDSVNSDAIDRVLTHLDLNSNSVAEPPTRRSLSPEASSGVANVSAPQKRQGLISKISCDAVCIKPEAASSATTGGLLVARCRKLKLIQLTLPQPIQSGRKNNT
ncbi:hypothetical protein ON010_g5418 [Phytophthora cinnamomi]|nr:hypothetical protein ON010_g5418 [Phytophthora cinnamomi]